MPYLINVVELYFFTLIAMFLVGMIGYKITNGKVMAFLFAELFGLMVCFIAFPFALGISEQTTLVYMLDFIIVFFLGGLIGKLGWDTPAMILLWQTIIAGISFIVFSSLLGMIG